MTEFQERHLQILQEVLSLPTAPLYEHRVIEYIKNFTRRLDFTCTEDIYGSLMLEYDANILVPAIALVAHMDHPGFEVVSVEKAGVKMQMLGGGACPDINDTLVLFHDGHETCVTVDAIVKDVNSKKLEYILVSGVELQNASGFAMPNVTPFCHSGEKIQSRAIDDLAGCAALLALLELLTIKHPHAHVYFLFTRGEEIGFIGAFGIATSGVIPHKTPVISLEASKMLPEAEQGKGVVVRIGDRRTIFDGKITAFLLETAQKMEKSGLRFQKRVLDGGVCEASVFASFGYPTSGLAVPLGCYHNHGENASVEAEHIHLADWYSMIDLLWETVTNTETMIGWEQRQRAYFLERFEKYHMRILKTRDNRSVL